MVSSAKKQVESVSRHLLDSLPLVMQAVTAEVRRTGHTPSPAHFRLLHILAAGRCSLGALAEHGMVRLATISRSITTLEDRGWVRRIRSPDDGRVVLAELTGEGHAVLREIREEALASVVRRLETLSPQELRELEDGLHALERAFRPTTEFEMEREHEGN